MSGGREFSVANRCAKQKVAFFLPLLEQTDPDVLGPLWPGYVFCRVTEHKLNVFKRDPAVNKILTEARQQELLNHLSVFGTFNTLTNSVSPGDRVRVRTGRLEGVEARVEHVSDDLPRIKIAVKLLNRDVFLDCDLDQVEVNDTVPQKIRVIPIAEPEFLSNYDPEQELNIELAAINDELVRYLSKHPERMREIDPYRFEQLVAELLHDMGYEVQITQRSKDGGRDILAVMRLPGGVRTLTVVECKRYSPKNKVGIDLVERLLWVMDRKDNASVGMIATTSYFTQEARAREREYQWRLNLRDFDEIREWLANYGRWAQSDESGLWLPAEPLHRASEARLWRATLRASLPIDTGTRAPSLPTQTVGNALDSLSTKPKDSSNESG